ncbi:cytochrome P450 [Sporichthya polymorpha]|uniref:cytochrome P450 n=1 Tax=Sporichthya polymorpha TaxID=35751 RepID=UPI0003A9C81A|nr:cytochrome P450 [Sporichthya polymorpha]
MSVEQCPYARVTRLADVTKLLRSKSALANEPELFANVAEDPVNGEINVREFLAASFIFSEGESHRSRRKLLNPLVRTDALTGIREDIILPEADRLLASMPAGADGTVSLDLVEFLERVFIHFTARLIGLTDLTDERIALFRSLAGPIAAGTSSAYLADRATINAQALAAKARYRDEILLPSLAWHREMRRRIDAGEVHDDEVPGSFLRMAAAGLDPRWADDDNVVVESSMLFAASVGTSTQSVVHTVDLLHTWFAAHPEDLPEATDPTFLLNALCETIRLRAPFSPYNTRRALEDHVLSDGTAVRAGQELHVELMAANRDPDVFGDDAHDFNPRRPPPEGNLARYGVGFGMGTHQCYGLRVVVGNDGKGGAHVELLRKLMSAGVRPDPDNPPTSLVKDMSKFAIADIPRYLTYPVTLSA